MCIFALQNAEPGNLFCSLRASLMQELVVVSSLVLLSMHLRACLAVLCRSGCWE